MLLGEISIDLNAPCDVLRTYMHRNFRDKLNKEDGDSFLFILPNLKTQAVKNNIINSLSREEEGQTFSKQVAPFQTDSKTLIGAFTVTLTPELGEKKVWISEFEVDEDEEKEKETSGKRGQKGTGEEEDDDEDDDAINNKFQKSGKANSLKRLV